MLLPDDVLKRDVRLEQVIILSRHGLRAPLASSESLQPFMPSSLLTQWQVPIGYLTRRGAILERYFGRYLAHWLDENGLVMQSQVPTEKDIIIYTNSVQRTIATGLFFVAGAYPRCHLPIHYKMIFNQMDPVFNPVLTSYSPEFHQQALAAMQADLAQREGVNQAGYDLLARGIRQQNRVYDEQLFSKPTTFRLQGGIEPALFGSLRLATLFADRLILQYYEGVPYEKMGWSQCFSMAEWALLGKIKDNYLDLLFTPSLLAKHIVKPLVHEMWMRWQDEQAAKVTCLVGHDANIASLLSALGVKPYQLPHQFENTPIGGKVVFQRWRECNTRRSLMKIEYFYQTHEQIRTMVQLTPENPPQRVMLEMASCPIDEQGFCDWHHFESVMRTLL